MVADSEGNFAYIIEKYDRVVKLPRDVQIVSTLFFD